MKTTSQVLSAVAAAALLGVPAALAESTPMQSVDKLARVAPRIVNGLLTSEFATTGQLLNGSDPASATSWCSGTLIGCRTFLTAAHCVEEDLRPSSYHVFLQHAGTFAVSSIAVHPSYSFPVADVAVLRLATEVAGIAPTPINTVRTPAFGTSGVIAGFGRSGGANDDYGLKRYGSVTTANCSVAGESNTTSVCWSFTDPLGAPGSNSNTCNADSGGPLFVDFGSGDVVAGITSGGTGFDCLPEDASFDTNVFHYRNWIEQQGGSDLARRSCGGGPQVGESGADVATATGTLNNANRQAVHSFQVAPGTSDLRVAMNSIDDGNADFDLYVRRGAAPTTSTYDCRANGANHLGYCAFTAPGDGTWYALVQRASGAGAYQLTATQFGSACQEGSPCDDGNACTSGDVCQSGVCIGSAVANGTPCDDGDACSAVDACQAGICSGSGSTCGDGVVQSCEECDDGNTVGGDACNADCTLPAPAEVHDTVLDPIKPVKVKLGTRSFGVFKSVRVKVRNADLDERFGHAVTLSATDGDCPPGTVFFVEFGFDGTTTIDGGRVASGKVLLDIDGTRFTTANKRSPDRCTAEVRVSGPGTDPTPENNVAPLVIDVFDRSDY